MWTRKEKKLHAHEKKYETEHDNCMLMMREGRFLGSRQEEKKLKIYYTWLWAGSEEEGAQTCKGAKGEETQNWTWQSDDNDREVLSYGIVGEMLRSTKL